MVRKNSENQLDLFKEQSEVPIDPRFKLLKPASVAHDYGGARSTDQDEAGHEFPFVQPQSEIKVDIPTVAISLRGRAQALMDIMEFYDYENAHKGRKKQRKNPDSALNQQRGVANMMENSEQKRARYFARFMEGIKYLAAEDEMKQVGVVADDPDNNFRTSLQSDLNQQFLEPGRVNQKRRDDMIKGLNQQAETFGFRLSSEEKNKPKKK